MNDELRRAAESFGCTFDGTYLYHGGRVVGSVPTPWRAVRPDGGFTTFHRNAETAVLALLTTHYTPAKGQ